MAAAEQNKKRVSLNADKLDKLYQKYVKQRNTIYNKDYTIGRDYTTKSNAEHAIDLANEMYNQEGKSIISKTKEVRKAGNRLLNFVFQCFTVPGVMTGELKQRFLETYMRRMLNIFQFITPLEVLRNIIYAGKPVPEVYDWKYIFFERDSSRTVWKFWKLMTDDWDSVVKPKLNNRQTVMVPKDFLLARDIDYLLKVSGADNNPNSMELFR